jgi:hypothetical protein
MGDKVEYHIKYSCNKCTFGVNALEIRDSEEGLISECKTKCRDCGFEDYWSHGFFKSGSEMVGKCKTYKQGGGHG